ncbi:HNH endonuclease signature motif containing protein [Microlunatus flavus]|uniref:HNH nuclease domain-containing protein n=1 Tax=Microlunatus flavus TaxID=1036181 RepID=A0A1H8Z5C1_9ACTN|nr:HNH endonuclease signature motif containing protein [Microlunatus flavus]SEP59655.1 protein of unknown function [Microlunatus flavus]
MALAAVESVEEVLHPTTAALTGLLAQLSELTADALGGVEDESTEADLVDQVGLLERLRSAVAATQAAAMVRLTRVRVERETAEQQRPERIGRGLAEEIALACRLSPTVAARRLGAAKAWWFDLPHTYAALAAGRLHERVANAVAEQTRHLPAVTRREVDQQLHAPRTDLPGLGVRRALAAITTTAYAADPRAYVERGRHARDDRYVALRPAPDTMSVLSGYLPVEQGVACLAALRKHTDSAVATGDERTRGQIMADTLVERLTGQTRAGDVAVEIQVIVPVDALVPDALVPEGVVTDVPSGPGPDGLAPDGLVPDSSGVEGLAPRSVEATGTATVTGLGALPLSVARQLIDDSGGTKHLRLLHRSPAGHLVDIGGRRRFTGALADLVLARDQTCREPYCDAPVRHLDHVQRHTDGGPTTLPNARGLCARHNLAREQPGWSATVVHDGLGDRPHTVVTTAPTGHDYTSRAPDPP